MRHELLFRAERLSHVELGLNLLRAYGGNEWILL